MNEFSMTKTSPIVSTPKGKLRGFHYNGVDHFFGIRYAKAKRFQMPEPVPAWEGVRDAGSYGMICPVLYEPRPTGEVMIPHRFWPSSEHCQYLNIWTSSCDPSAKKPVLFWIHGGGFSSGFCTGFGGCRYSLICCFAFSSKPFRLSSATIFPSASSIT